MTADLKNLLFLIFTLDELSFSKLGYQVLSAARARVFHVFQRIREFFYFFFYFLFFKNWTLKIRPFFCRDFSSIFCCDQQVGSVFNKGVTTSGVITRVHP